MLHIFYFKGVVLSSIEITFGAKLKNIIKGENKVDKDKNATVYNLNKEYRIVSLKGNKCSLFFKNKQNNLRATLEGCGKILTNISVNGESDLTAVEKGYLLSFVRAKKYAIAKEVADVLEVSILQYEDGREEYLSERLLKKRIASGLNFAKVYAARLRENHLIIPAETRNCSYNFTHCEIGKITIGEGCNVNIDLRDNNYTTGLVVKDKFSGTLNLSRTALESVFIGNNCRCNFSLSDSKKCVNMQIGEVSGGNINVVNSCLYALQIGYYSYADIMLSNNVIKKEIAIGNSFRGGLYAINQNCEWLKVGNDCKGWVKLNCQAAVGGVKNLMVDNDFSGNINLSGDAGVRNISIGERCMGKVDATYASAVEMVVVGKYFTGNLDLGSSSVKNIFIDYGANGSVNVKNCKKCKFLQTSSDNDLYIEGEIKSVDALSNEGKVIYYFEDVGYLPIKVPFYKRLYENIYKRYRG